MVKVRPSSTDLWTAVAFVGCFALLELFRYQLTPDGFATLFSGREVARFGIPAHNWLNAENRGGRWIDEQWLSQWLLYRTWAVGGYAAVAAAAIASLAFAYALLGRIILERGAGPWRALKWTVLALAVALPDLSVRAQAFGYLCFAVLLWALLRDLDKPSTARLVAVLLLLVLWANLHGSVLLGAGVFGCYCLWRAVDLRRVRYGLAAIASAATVLATPYGLGTVDYYRATLGNAAIRGFASEWRRASPTSTAAIGFFAAVLVTGYVMVRASRRKVHPSSPIAIAATVLTVAGFAALRWEGFAAFLLVILATDLLDVLEPNSAAPNARRLRMAVIGASALLTLCVVAISSGRTPFSALTPVADAAVADRYALSHPRMTILADDRSASALLWLYPDLRGRIALDDRLELFPQGTVRAWGAFIRGRDRGWLELADRYRLIVVSRANRALLRRLEAISGLRELHRDKVGAVFVRLTALH